MKNLNLVWELQQLERKKDILLRAMKDSTMANELRELKSKIGAFQAEIKEQVAQSAVLKRSEKGVEDQVTMETETLKKLKEELYAANISLKELETKQIKIDIIEGKVKEKENTAYHILGQISELDGKTRGLLKSLEENKEKFRSINHRYHDLKEKHKAELDVIEQEIEKVKSKIPNDLYNKYRRLCDRFPDRQGIAQFKNGFCSGCHMSQSFDVTKKIKEEEGHIYCDNCERLLVLG